MGFLNLKTNSYAILLLKIYKNQFAYIKVYTAWGIQEIVCWASQYSRFQKLIKKDAKIAVLCSKKDGQAFVHTIKSYEQWENERLLEW